MRYPQLLIPLRAFGAKLILKCGVLNRKREDFADVDLVVQTMSRSSGDQNLAHGYCVALRAFCCVNPSRPIADIELPRHLSLSWQHRALCYELTHHVFDAHHHGKFMVKAIAQYVDDLASGSG